NTPWTRCAFFNLVDQAPPSTAMTTMPRVTDFSVSPTSTPVNSPVTITYAVSGGSYPLQQVELWRTDYASYLQGNWPQYPAQTSVLSGNTYTYAGSFADTPPMYAGTWVYGVHVRNTAYAWNDERNSQSGFMPTSFEPVVVSVYQVAGFTSQAQPF